MRRWKGRWRTCRGARRRGWWRGRSGSSGAAWPEESGDLPDAERPTVSQSIEELLKQFVQTARLPRRIAERTRMILLAQRTLAGDRRRRGSLASFRRHPLFNEALAVFEMSV